MPTDARLEQFSRARVMHPSNLFLYRLRKPNKGSLPKSVGTVAFDSLKERSMKLKRRLKKREAGIFPEKALPKSSSSNIED
ncbi:hypothetical protein SUGI_0658960 [Cryptomeria japonica]|nr:hypothetical protein SUGI_0658960 [Cryptomeria japonica]